MSKVVAFDVDGVLLDCEKGFVVVATLMFKKKFTKLNNSYDFGLRYGLSDDQVYMVFEEMKNHPEGWGNLPVLPGAAEAFRKVKEYGCKIHLVSAIPESIRDLRLESLYNHGMVADSIHCAGHHLASKGDILIKLAPVVFVDDRLSHLYSAPFVNERVLIDNGDDQNGLVPTPEIALFDSLSSWVSDWSVRQGYEGNPGIKRSPLTM